MELNEILNQSIEKGASDIYLKPGAPPTLRINGQLAPIGDMPLSDEDTKRISIEIMDESKFEILKSGLEQDFAFELDEDTRFRANIFLQRNRVALVMRRISNTVPGFEELALPPAVKKLAHEKRGLIIVTGTAGSGKTTTLASMIDYINNNRAAHVVTIEDPIEITHKDKLSIIEQREIGNDTHSYTAALKHVVRQAPDVILIGEMRDYDTVLAALSAAETGHLVLSTLHTIDALETINRIIDFFPEREDAQIRQTLTGSLRGIVSQRLLNKKDGSGRIPAVEVFISTPTTRDYLLDKNKMREIPKIMAKSEYDGMQTFDQCLCRLVTEGIVEQEEALTYATSPNELRLMIQQSSAGQTTRF